MYVEQCNYVWGGGGGGVLIVFQLQVCQVCRQIVYISACHVQQNLAESLKPCSVCSIIHAETEGVR